MSENLAGGGRFRAMRRGERDRLTNAGFDLVEHAAPRDRLDRCDLGYVGDREASLSPAPASQGGVRVRDVQVPMRVTMRLEDGRLVAHRRFSTRGGRLRLTPPRPPAGAPRPPPGAARRVSNHAKGPLLGFRLAAR